MLDVFVIRPDGTSRADRLLRSLSSSPAIRVHEVSATMLSTIDDLHSVSARIDQRRAALVHGRALIAQEFGCALSHQDVREQIAQSPNGAVVLEDDARVSDVADLVEVAVDFLNAHRGHAALLNLHRDRAWPETISLGRDRVRRLAPTPLAVAYAITPLAATRMVAVSQPIGHTADWPTIPTRYYSVTREVVRHGDEGTESLIDAAKTTHRVDAAGLGWAVFTLGHYRQHGAEFGGFLPWFHAMYEPRLRHHADRFWCALLVGWANLSARVRSVARAS